MSTTTIVKQEVLAIEQCCKCGISFAMPERFQWQRRQDKEMFYCPNGHPQHYTKSEADKLRTELTRKQAELDQAYALSRDSQRKADAAIKEQEKIKRKLKRANTRSVNGICPCCGRTFKNVQRHMASKHPKEAGKLCQSGVRP